jgi:hypothetical protein
VWMNLGEVFWVGLGFKFGEAVGNGRLLCLVFELLELGSNRVGLGADLLVDAGRCGGSPGSVLK